MTIERIKYNYCKNPQWVNIYGDVRVYGPIQIGEFTTIQDDVEIGEGTRIGAFNFICSGTKIGERVFLGQHVSITNDRNPIVDNDRFIRNGVTIEDDVSVGSQVVLLAGIILGKGCKIGAGSCVTKSVPAGETWVGNPARKLEK